MVNKILEDEYLDSQQVEIVGRSLLTSLFVAENIEVASPIRDRGIDLIVYNDSPNNIFKSRPIQLKTATKARFGIYRKYEKIPGLLMAYVWYAREPLKAVVYIMSYTDAVNIADKLKYTQSKSWLTDNWYSTYSTNPDLLSLLEKYKYKPGNLAELIEMQHS